MPRRHRFTLCLALTAALSLGACSEPEAPDKEQPPEPQASTAGDATDMRDAIQAPIDKAKAAEQAIQDAAQAQDAAVEAAGG